MKHILDAIRETNKFVENCTHSWTEKYRSKSGRSIIYVCTNCHSRKHESVNE